MGSSRKRWGYDSASVRAVNSFRAEGQATIVFPGQKSTKNFEASLRSTLCTEVVARVSLPRPSSKPPLIDTNSRHHPMLFLRNTFSRKSQSFTSLINRKFATMAPNTGKWKLNHTMLRVKDPQKSLEYYKFLGLSQINKLTFADNKFDLYFLGNIMP